MDDLAVRLTAHPKFRWMPGMLAVPPEWMRHAWGPFVVTSVDTERPAATCLQYGPLAKVLADGWTPDLADPATAGCLRAQLHEAAPEIEVWWSKALTTWAAGTRHSVALPVASDPIYGRCLAAALLAVWGPA